MNGLKRNALVNTGLPSGDAAGTAGGADSISYDFSATGGPVGDLHARLQTHFGVDSAFAYAPPSLAERGIESFSRWSGVVIFLGALAGLAYLLL